METAEACSRAKTPFINIFRDFIGGEDNGKKRKTGRCVNY